MLVLWLLACPVCVHCTVVAMLHCVEFLSPPKSCQSSYGLCNLMDVTTCCKSQGWYTVSQDCMLSPPWHRVGTISDTGLVPSVTQGWSQGWYHQWHRVVTGLVQSVAQGWYHHVTGLVVPCHRVGTISDTGLLSPPCRVVITTVGTTVSQGL